jgi:hypothetical protein
MFRLRERHVIALLTFIFLAGAGAVRAQNPPQNPPPPSNGEPPQKDQENPDNPAVPKPSLITPLPVQKESAPYHPVTTRQRLRWFISNTIGPPHLAAGVFTSGFGTALDRPREYGPGWGGFGDRYGMRLTGISTGNGLEASIGSLWSEDPRYFRVPRLPFKARLRSVAKQTFVARRADGNYAPAYARYIAVPGSNFLSNTWRVESEANTHDALLRTAEGFAGRMASNAYEEFWPSIKSFLFHHGKMDE